MLTKTTEIADGIFRLSTFVPNVTPDGFTFNQFLINAEEPLLFHTGPRACSASSPKPFRKSCRSRSSGGSLLATSKRTSVAR